MVLDKYNLFSEELINCFKFQYPKRWEKYKNFMTENLVFMSQKKIQEGIITYSRFIEDLDFLIDLIKELVEDG